MDKFIIVVDRSIEMIEYSQSEFSTLDSDELSLNSATRTNYEDPFFKVPAANITLTGVLDLSGSTRK